MPKAKSRQSEPWVRLEQWIEVEINNGQTVTLHYPSNQELLKIAARMDPPPDVVFRRFNFPDGVPAEYAWTLPTANNIAYGGAGIQRLRFEDWSRLIVTEGRGHAQASGHALRRWGTEDEDET